MIHKHPFLWFLILYVVIGVGFAILGDATRASDPNDPGPCALCPEGIFIWLPLSIIAWPLFLIFDLFSFVFFPGRPDFMLWGGLEVLVVLALFVGWYLLARSPRVKQSSSRV